MFSLLFNTPLQVKQGAAPAGMDPFSPAFNQMSASVDPAVYIGLLKLGIALLCLTFVLFAWRKLASLWEDWNTVARLLTQLVLSSSMGGLAYWAYNSYQVSAHFPEGLLAAVGSIGFGLGWWLAKKMGLTFIKPKERVAKGSVEASVAEVAKLVKKDGPSRIELAGVPIPKKSEAVHFMMLGATGSGKSVAIGQLLERTYADGDILILVDSGGDFASKYYTPSRDYILNPFDDRTVSWNPMAEMDGPYDAEALAKSIIPEGVGDSKEWNSYAQTFLGSCLTVLKQRNGSTINDLIYFAQQASLDELRDNLRGTAAYSQLESDKMFASIRVIVNNYLSAYTYLKPNASGETFSIKQFVSAGKPGALFITYRDDQLDTLRNLISCALDVASRTVLSLTPDANRRVWLVVDEFASIGKVQSVEAFATKARKAGGCLVVGLQSISQLKDKYGEHQAQSIMSCLGTWLVLRCADTDTADYMSRFLGEQTIVRHTGGSSEGQGGGSKSLSEQVTTQRTVLASELQELPPLHGFMRVAGGYPICAVELSVAHSRKATKPAYVAKDFSRITASTPAATMATRPAVSYAPAPVLEGVAKVVPDTAAAADVDWSTVRHPDATGPAPISAAPAPVAEAAPAEMSIPDATDRYIKELLAQLNNPG